MWVLEIRSRSSGRTASFRNYWFISPGPQAKFKKDNDSGNCFQLNNLWFKTKTLSKKSNFGNKGEGAAVNWRRLRNAQILGLILSRCHFIIILFYYYRHETLCKNNNYSTEKYPRTRVPCSPCGLWAGTYNVAGSSWFLMSSVSQWSPWEELRRSNC